MPRRPRPSLVALRALVALALPLALAALAAPPLVAQPAPAVPSPASVLGFEVGADRTLADWGQITDYFTRLARASDAMHLDTLGRTTNGLPFVVATITSPANQRRRAELEANQALLADPRRLDAATEARLLATQPAVVFIANNIHATEIASSQMAMELAWRLVTNDTLRARLDDVVVLLAPSMNPDGQQMITEWYRRHVGTAWEGGPLPWLYHPYTGHDNNRDWFMVTQRETRLVTDFLYGRWFPEVFYDVHQMGSGGARLFVPPMVDPVNPNLDPLIVRGIGHVGSEMALALEERGKSGVANSVIYDLWWHGGARSTPTRHNIIGVITEAASVRVASPIVQDTATLPGHARGLPEYERRANFPNPWPGGAWRLRDIVEYELIAAEALVALAAEQRAQYVRNFVTLGRRAIERGRTEGPHAFVIPAGQADRGAVARLVDVLRVGRVEVERATAPFRAAGETFAAGSHVVRLAQPYRAHAKDLLEVQRFPRLEAYPGGPAERPYDVAGWTLPLQMGVRVVTVDSALDAATEPVTGAPRAGLPPAACPAGPAAGAARDRRDTDAYRCPADPARVGLYRSWTASMDEGWTRWVLDDFRIPYAALTDSTVRAGGLRARFDVVVIPDLTLRELRDGLSAEAAPPPYAGGLGEAGIAALRAFAEEGGRLVLVDGATALAPAALGVDVELIATGGRGDTTADALHAPGSILRVAVDTAHAIGAGMPADAAVYFVNSHAFAVPAGSPARAIARYPARADDILLSGYLQGGARLAGRAAAVEAPVGRGSVVLFGFRPLYRGQSHGTFRMLFNALAAPEG